MDGAERFDRAVAAELPALFAAVAAMPPDRAGVRIAGNAAVRSLVRPDGTIRTIASHALGTIAHPVRAVLFDKSETTNWALGWHQDRTICVRERIDVAGFGPWTTKSGLQHVEPPFDLFAGMATLRVHLDPVDADNAPLLIAPGSHRAGRVPVEAIAATVRRHGVSACLAGAGDVWLYATPILHASDAAVRPRRRRVLQIDYTARPLPGGLQWQCV
ncbi:phytanoyl-CoA dioxygenase family protein [Sphingomonas sp. 2R-10]|uniref:phytanoyl-CoA dioxygenase family protein n=1 Tax=Sphingomonas sp. 2R-10 TaxID=3045148 RepID=UPI0019D1B6C9|nr:phytanoyl-CoA dioxygenase family protein [Sphingomonas sp. 2R-10]MDJ0278370.1 phytanoyl-CoA dioxygenase family protein [Sphingomonas sp. 2R-10]